MLVKEQSKAKIEDPAGWEAPGTWAGAAVAACPAQRHEPLTPVPVDARAFRNGIQIHGRARSALAVVEGPRRSGLIEAIFSRRSSRSQPTPNSCPPSPSSYPPLPSIRTATKYRKAPPSRLAIQQAWCGLCVLSGQHGCGCGKFGTKRPQVQILSPRPVFLASEVRTRIGEASLAASTAANSNTLTCAFRGGSSPVHSESVGRRPEPDGARSSCAGHHRQRARIVIFGDHPAQRPCGTFVA